MSKQANPTVIGGFVLGALALVVVAILALSSGALLRDSIKMVTFFPGSVQGLSVGAQVQFQGVPIGQVTNIGVDYLPDRDSFRIPVDYEIWPQNVHVIGGTGEAEVRDVLQRLIDEKGLRARLESVSVVTGQYLVALSMNPNLPKRSYAATPGGPIRVPAIAATRDRVEEMLDNLDLGDLVANATDTLAAITELAESGTLREAVQNLNGTLVAARSLLANLDTQVTPLGEQTRQTLGDYGTLARTLDGRIGPLVDRLDQATRDLSSLTRNINSRIDPLADAATATLDDASRAMRAVASMTGEGSTTRHELDRLLSEASRAARSLRSLTDYLERHPEALLQGKR
ncbi:MAG: MlaD family protein [Thiohalocapsa sp.]